MPRRFRAVALAGNLEIDLTRARRRGDLADRGQGIVGAVTILVPPWLRVECDGTPILGGFDVQRKVASTSSPDAPLIRISGTAFMGAVDVKVVDPDA